MRAYLRPPCSSPPSLPSPNATTPNQHPHKSNQHITTLSLSLSLSQTREGSSKVRPWRHHLVRVPVCCCHLSSCSSSSPPAQPEWEQPQEARQPRTTTERWTRAARWRRRASSARSWRGMKVAAVAPKGEMEAMMSA